MSPQAKLAAAAIRFLRLAEVRKITGLSRSTIYRLQAEGRFPQSIRISIRAVGWIEHEVEAWIAQRIECSRSGWRTRNGVNRPGGTAA